jgi:nitrogen fixation protein FixH
MNWGTGIVISFVLFIAMIFLFIFLGGREPSDLVSEDYYAQELKYEERIQAARNTAPYKDSIEVNRTESLVMISFPAAALAGLEEGTVEFFRPSEADDDVLFKLEPSDEGIMLVPRSELKPGRYEIKINWTCKGVVYYWEKGFIN